MVKLILYILIAVTLSGQVKTGFQIARLKYNGGGDWYNDPSAEVNLLNFVSEHTNIKTIPEYKFVELGSSEMFSYPFLFLTGHGNIVISSDEVKKLRTYLNNGGFLYVDDDYGLDNAFRREIKKAFPDKDLVELPFDYGLYHCLFNFNYGPPKTHEHDNKPPQGFGIFIDGRLAVYYTYESNPSDGWTDARVHNTPQDKREEALKFGANIVVWALSN
ncbi:hypothetical protein ASZ90_004415 [hydrocarbon metagenome]|uniref:DUF4159 domain-containing protein n=1 Tax=hydrocarbon metagenome TaxID=938273 RepID=A0A0W8FY49_9ZZZZ